MRARVKEFFFDKEARVDRNRGDEFECDEERFAAINAAGFGQLVERAGAAAEEVAEEVAEEAAEEVAEGVADEVVEEAPAKPKAARARKPKAAPKEG